MPFNPVYNLKAANIWLQQTLDEPQTQISPSSRIRTRSSDNAADPIVSSPSKQSSTIKPSTSLISLFCCFIGFFFDRLLGKQQSPVGYVHVAFWAVFLYVLGSIVYVIDSILLWPYFNPSYSDDFLNPAIYLNFVAAAIFVLDAIVCFVDWNLQIQNIKKAEKLAKGELLTAIVGISHSTSWLYFYNNIFFLAAAMIYLIQAFWYRAIAENLLLCEETMYVNNCFSTVFYLNVDS